MKNRSSKEPLAGRVEPRLGDATAGSDGPDGDRGPGESSQVLSPSQERHSRESGNPQVRRDSRFRGNDGGGDGPARFSGRDIVVALLLAVVAFAVYNANLRSIGAVDTYASRYLPFSIWRYHSVTLDPVATPVAQGRKPRTGEVDPDTAWWIYKGKRGDLVSFYPVTLPVIIAPLYYPAVRYVAARDWDPVVLDQVARVMEKLVASFIAAAAVGLLYLLMRRRCNPATAIALAATFALGTTMWVVSSQALWTHGLSALLVIATMLLLTGPCTPARAVAAGFLCALIPCVRQPDVILAAGLGLYGLWWARPRLVVPYVAGALPVPLLVLAYNLMLVGSYIGGYGLVLPSRTVEFFADNPVRGVAGLLFSPSHGLFVFSPFLLFIVIGLPWILRAREFRGFTLMAGGAALLQLALYGFGDWRQGASWGPRWLTDMLPILFWMLPPVLGALPRAGRVVFGIACVAAVAIEAIGAFWYTGASDAALYAVRGPGTMHAAWQPANAPFVAELAHPRAAADLLVPMRGNVDVVEVHAGSGEPARLEVQGWTQAGVLAPSWVSLLVDGHAVGGTGSFFERADVARATGTAAPSGWKISAPIDGLEPGLHTVSVMVQPMADAPGRLLKSRSFTVAPFSDTPAQEAALAEAARHAAQRLAERQQAQGYWLTAFTTRALYDQPGREMNTFLNAVLLDLLDPVVAADDVLAPVAPGGVAGISQASDAAARLAEPVRRARAFLAGQVEADGLVRYHGRPDAPTIGTLGCAITPDADDTALVWRVAPPGRRDLLPGALATLERFRRPDGLYRTWLAPRDHYQCLDPGKDPNPADIAIQAHLLMLFAQADPPKARALCDALRARLNDDDIWVYYRSVPTLVLLRLEDLRKAGCALRLPPARLATAIPGQGTWVKAAGQLQALVAGDRRALADRVAAGIDTSRLLREIAADDFAMLARDPPLLYHNDLSATVRRYYWSEDFGYALWLRLYLEHERMKSEAR